MSNQAVKFKDVTKILYDSLGFDRDDETQAVLNVAARAICPDYGTRLLPWRVHIFHRAQGGFWVCVNRECSYRDSVLCDAESDWGFGALWFRQRDKCKCEAPVFELFACHECGASYLLAGLTLGKSAHLVPRCAIWTDDFSVDAEPDSKTDNENIIPTGTVILSPDRQDPTDRYLRIEDGRVYDNAPLDGGNYVRIRLDMDHSTLSCCSGAANSSLVPQHYGPPFFMGTTLPTFVEMVTEPLDKAGLPMGGRRAITFSDSRQGTAGLAAKLQRDAERNLTRSFLYHAVQEDNGLDDLKRKILNQRLEKFTQINDPIFDEDIQSIKAQLSGRKEPIPWSKLVTRFSEQVELCNFAIDVWSARIRGGNNKEDKLHILAKLFLYRELFRRPKVQNNPETMGLLRLSFPKLEEKAGMQIPDVLSRKGIDSDSWVALALAAVDFVFRERLAAGISPDWMLRYVSPRSGTGPNSICHPDLANSARQDGTYPWFESKPRGARPSRLLRLVYRLINGQWNRMSDQDQAREVLESLWSLITSTVAEDIGGGLYQLDFKHAAVVRLDQGWVCLVSRRIIGYSPRDMSPYNPDRQPVPIKLPRLPRANAGGLEPNARVESIDWCRNNEEIKRLRKRILWTDLHDRIATYSPFIRAQEHSAQIKRQVLADYGQQFEEGRINLLNCSTTMEMGVDIPNVQIVVNANVPPSVANYRQRVGRAGRRNEPWSFSITFCRNLPLDQIVFDNPVQMLSASVVAPAVSFDSPKLIARHVNAALLAEFFRQQTDGIDLMASAGGFLGAALDTENPFKCPSMANNFLDYLRKNWTHTDDLTHLTRRTCLEDQDDSYLVAESAEAFETMMKRWQKEYSALLEWRDAAGAKEVEQAFETRARRMHGEFLLGELARRGWTPSYGFPIDVVTFHHLSDDNVNDEHAVVAFGEHRGRASRTADIAIRGYAPGAEVVIDALVYRSEGIFPAWGANADVSRLEDLQDFWECSSCSFFDLVRIVPEACPKCNTPVSRRTIRRCLRPTGYLGRRAPHTGYENLGYVPYELPKISAAGASWHALPNPEAGRIRSTPDGQVITLGSGLHGLGYALCLSCGRAEPETERRSAAPPQSIRKHHPLAEAPGMNLEQGYYCPGGYTEPQRIQRNVHLSHVSHTDVFELQLPIDADRDQGLALAAGIREELAIRLGAAAREIGIAVSSSTGPYGENRVSSFLYDRASGGAGLVLRLSDQEWFHYCLNGAHQRLDCNEDCRHGCPACILRPDINFKKEALDRVGARRIANHILNGLQFPETMSVFGSGTNLLGSSLTEWLYRQKQMGVISTICLYLHGSPSDWELADWPIAKDFRQLKESGVNIEPTVQSEALVSKNMEIALQLDLHRLAAHATLNHVSELPAVGNALIVAVIRVNKGNIAIAAYDKRDAVPGPLWGLGLENVLVQGPAPTSLPEKQPFAIDRLIDVSAGNAHMIRIYQHPDGQVSTFGHKFWQILAEEAPLTVNALHRLKVRTICYTDRYLLTPLSLRFLYEVVRNLPGGEACKLQISTACRSGLLKRCFKIFHTYPDDLLRRKALEMLFPRGQINIHDKFEVPHARSFALRLGDGRKITILLDQGFGSWYANVALNFDFRIEPTEQVNILKLLNFEVNVHKGQNVPIVLKEFLS